MATISLCMIVKNEEQVLARCLDSVAHLMDEIIIVDTGSTDRTKEIAKRYTDQIYDFTWVSDFSAARNFSFSKASMEYIYAPDADEVLDEENQRKFQLLKKALISDIEIVQMKYETVANDTVLNAHTEYRPKLFKRQRNFTWIDPIHETVRLDPVVYDSDITILHMPQQMHQKRDFSIFEQTIAKEGKLSDKLLLMYATELVKTADVEDLQRASAYFQQIYDTSQSKEREYAAIVLAKYDLLADEDAAFLKLALKEVATEPASEICYFLGQFYDKKGDRKEASLWYTNAIYETGARLDIHLSGDKAYEALISCYEALIAGGTNEEREYYQKMMIGVKEDAKNWKLPEEN